MAVFELPLPEAQGRRQRAGTRVVAVAVRAQPLVDGRAALEGVIVETATEAPDARAAAAALAAASEPEARRSGIS